MKELHVISIIGIIYGLLLTLVTFIFFRDYVIWAALGSAVSLFNHSSMIHATKGKLRTERLVMHIIQRFTIYIIVIVFLFFDTQGQEQQFIINSYIFLLLGFIATKIGVYVYQTPLIKKPKQVEETKHDEL